MTATPSTTVTRPMTAAERRYLASFGSGSQLKTDLTTAGGCTAFIALGLYAVIAVAWRLAAGCDCSGGSRHKTTLVVAAVLALILSSSIWRDVLRQAKRRREAGMGPASRDLERGMAQVLTAEVKRYVDIGEFEDEGAGFFIELTDGLVLTIIDQEYYPYAEGFIPDPGDEDLRGTFPSNRIEYAYAPESGIALSCRALGAPLRAMGWTETRAKHFPSANSKTSVRAAEHGEIESGPLEEVLARRGYALQSFD